MHQRGIIRQTTENESKRDEDKKGCYFQENKFSRYFQDIFKIFSVNKMSDYQGQCISG